MATSNQDFRVKNGLLVTTTATIESSLNATSTQTGALQVRGGAGIGGNLWVGGEIVASKLTIEYTTVTTTSVVTDDIFTVNNNTNASSTTTAALVVQGGVGIGRDLRVGGIIYGTFSGSITGTATTATNLANGTAGQVPYQTAPGATSFFGPGTAGDIIVSRGTTGPTYQNTLTLAGTTSASSTNTGALQVRGGVGIAENLYVGGSFRLGTTATDAVAIINANSALPVCVEVAVCVLDK